MVIPVNSEEFALCCPEVRDALAKLDEAVMAARNDPQVVAAMHGFRDGREVRNPAIGFTEEGEAGDYDEFSEQDYNRLLALTEDAARYWNDKPELGLSVGDIRALEDAMRELSERIHKVVNMIDAREAALAALREEDRIMAATVLAGGHTEGEADRSRCRYAGGFLSRDMLVQMAGGGVNHGLDRYVAMACSECGGAMAGDTEHFRAVRGSLYSSDGMTLYIGRTDQDPDQSSEQADRQPLDRFVITDSFYRFLASLDRWDFAEGRFEEAMARLLKEDDAQDAS